MTGKSMMSYLYPFYYTQIIQECVAVISHPPSIAVFSLSFLLVSCCESEGRRKVEVGLITDPISCSSYQLTCIVNSLPQNHIVSHVLSHEYPLLKQHTHTRTYIPSSNVSHVVIIISITPLLSHAHRIFHLKMSRNSHCILQFSISDHLFLQTVSCAIAQEQESHF